MSDVAVGRPHAEILSFTALRGLAAWWVAIYHFDTILPLHGWFERFIVKGPLAVDLFFIMSGFVMALSYGQAFQTSVSWRGYGRFMGLRLARIYPLHIVMLLAFLSVPIALELTGREPLWGHLEPDYFLASIFLVQNWATNVLDWNAPAWSISTELMFYFLFPFAALLLARFVRDRGFVLLAGAGILLFMAYGFGDTTYTDDFGLKRCLPECLLGMLLFYAASLLPARKAGSIGLFGVAMVAIGLDAGHLASDQATMPVAFACLLWSVTDPRFLVSRLLANPVLLWLGRVSFSTYLVHFLVKYWLKFLLGGRVPDMALFVVYIACVAFASWVLHYALELPGQSVGRLVANWLFQPAGPSRAAAPGMAGLAKPLEPRP